jgi:serine acetyltransferase
MIRRTGVGELNDEGGPAGASGLRDEVSEDLLWYGSPSWPQLIKTLLKERTFRPVFTLRLVQHSPRALRPLSALLHRAACSRAGIDLPSGVTAGPGLKLTHGWGLVVSPRTVIGRDVILMHGVTLGGRGADGRAPTIGDGAFIGPNASVLGDVTVGAGATVSAGCVVVEDVPGSTMVTIDTSALVRRAYERPREKRTR